GNARDQSLMRSNSSQPPIAVRLAISGAAPAFSAVTYMLFTNALRLTLPSALWMSWNVSQPPMAVRLAISELAPAFSAVTIRLLACERRAMLPWPASSTSKVSHGPMAVRLAINGLAPALSAHTYAPFACARRLMTLDGGGGGGWVLPVVVTRTDEMASLPPVLARLGLSAVNVHDVPLNPEPA